MNLILRSVTSRAFFFSQVSSSKKNYSYKLFLFFSFFCDIFWKVKRKTKKCFVTRDFRVSYVHISETANSWEKRVTDLYKIFLWSILHVRVRAGAHSHRMTWQKQKSSNLKRLQQVFLQIQFCRLRIWMIWFSEIYLWVRRVKSAWRVKTSCTQIVLVSFILILLFNLLFAFLNNEICEERTISLHC